MALRWKKKPKETGLRAVGAAPRGSQLHDGGKVYAWTAPFGGGSRGPQTGWFWVSPTAATGEFMNTSNAPVPDEDVAKAAAMAWVTEQLAKQPN